ncbi:MAG: hypothetical protein AB8B53_05005 [Flavobacteriales bacterium]
MLTFNFHHSEPISLEKISEDLIHEVMRTADLADLKHVKVLHKSTRELDVFFKDQQNVVLVLNLIGSFYRAETVISSTGDLEDMIMEFTKFTYKLKAHYPFKLTQTKSAELASQITEDYRNQRNYKVDDYSYNADYSNPDAREISFNELSEEIRNSNTARTAQRTTSPFNQRRQKKKKKEAESPFGSIGKIISFIIKSIIILGLVRTCTSRFGNTNNEPNIQNTYAARAKVVSITDLPAYLANGKSADGTSRADWKMMHYSYSHKNNTYRNQRIISSKELETLGTHKPIVGGYINVEINSDFPSLSTVKTIIVVPAEHAASEITHEFLNSELDEEVIELDLTLIE